MREKIYSPEKIVELFDIIGIGKGRGPKLVFTNGVFDLLHVGHLRYLNAARHVGDMLLVAINDDESCRRLKGPNRPILALRERLEVLAGLECVDYVTWFSEDTPIPLMQKIQPELLVKGANYTVDQVVGKAEAEAWGAQVRTLELTEGRSTTNLIERVLATRAK